MIKISPKSAKVKKFYKGGEFRLEIFSN